jgi:Sulfotransferase family
VKELHYWDRQRGRSRFNKKAMGHATWLRYTARELVSREGDAPRDLRFFGRYLLLRRSDEWYASLFRPGSGSVSGEITPAYCTLDAPTIDLFAQCLPDVKIIFMMRDPIERAWSSASKDLARAAGVHVDDIPDDRLISYFRSKPLALRSDYTDVLDRWRAVYDDQQIFVGFLEDLSGEPEAFFGRLGEFLGVEREPFLANLDAVGRRNSTTAFRSQVPPVWERFLAEQYDDMTAELARRYDGPPVVWRRRVEGALSRR